MDPSLVCRIFFAVGVLVDLGGLLSPWFKEDIMNYGSRQIQTSDAKERKPNILLDFIASLQVPHSWFTYFYAFSVASSLFWGFQIFTRGSAIGLLGAYSSREITMTAQQATLMWFLMLLQGTRRLYESIMFTKPTQATMWVGLWLIGIAYYLFTGIGVWVEGVAAINTTGSLPALPSSSSLTMKNSIGIPLFILASYTQHICHKHLASLKKYTLPHHPMFQSIICPHYTSECFIYLALAIVAAPPGLLLNRTVLSGLAFVVSNLCVTANSTKKWYIEKFGAEKVQSRWKIFPCIY